MNENQFALKIVQRLNHGLLGLSDKTNARLASARQLALAHQKAFAPQSALAAVGDYLLPDSASSRSLLFSFVFLVSVSFYFMCWMADEEISEMGVVDTELLADELPVSLLTDRGFKTWLKRASPE